jgi:hypothetical protein
VSATAPHVIRKEREQDIQRTIIAWLRLKRYFWWRNNVGAANYQGKNQNRYVRFGTKGAPDLFVVRRVITARAALSGDKLIPETEIWGIECKRPNGSQSADQRAFEAAFREAGGYYLVAKSLEDVTEVLG